MGSEKIALLISPQELQKHLNDKQVFIVDLSLPSIYAQGHVPNAVRLDFPKILNPHDNCDGDVPSDEKLSQVFSELGLTPEHHVVAYDAQDNPMATRLLWTLEELGHSRFSLLDGGRTAWVADNMPLEMQPVRRPPVNHQWQSGGQCIATKQYILSKLNDPQVILLDTRLELEFTNELVITDRGGNIPGAVHFDWQYAIDENDAGRFRSPEELLPHLHGLGLTEDKEIIVYCQTHLRSSHTYFVLKYLGFKKLRGYAAGYSEWGNDTETPIENEHLEG